tara:strand:+ start:2017 stop:2301 length:285 start_codon:yes stop_codon:yes gene_type:complete
MVDAKANIRKYFLKEEAPANVAGGGHVAGIGVGPQGEPGISVSQQFKYANNVMDFLISKDEEDQEDPIQIKRSDKFHNSTLLDSQRIAMKLLRR